MIKKYICSCFDGFSGKYCDYCEGKIEDNKCIEDDNVNDNLIDTNINDNIHERNDNEKYLDCEKCFNGICDSKIGKCICDYGWKGKYCDELVNKINDNKSLIEKKRWNITFINYFSNYFREIIGFVFILFILYVCRNVIKGKNNQQIEYNVLGQSDDDTINSNSINDDGNDNNKLELMPTD